MSFRMDLVFYNLDGTEYEQKEAPRIIPRPDVIGRHEGIVQCSEIVIPLIGPSGQRILFRNVGYVHENGAKFGEYGVFNASMDPDDAIGYMRGMLWDRVSQRALTEVSHLFDQGAQIKSYGQWQYAVDREKLDIFMSKRDYSKLPKEAIDAIAGKVRTGFIPGDWARNYQPGGEDHYGDTNLPGSPNAKYESRVFTAHALFPDQPYPLNPLRQWLEAQFGCVIHEDGDRRIERGGRGLLFDYDKSGFVVPYSQLDKQHEFSYGGAINRSDDNFGRNRLPIVEAATVGFSNHHEWLGKRLIWPGGWQIPYGGTVRMGNRITHEGWNGRDGEHDFRFHPISALCLLTPSVFARDYRKMMMETAISTGQYDGFDEMPENLDHNSRAWSWSTYNFMDGGFVLGDKRMSQIAINACSYAIAEDHIEHEFAKPWLLMGQRVHRNQSDEFAVEQPWQCAPGLECARKAQDLSDANAEGWQLLETKLKRIISAGVVKDSAGKPLGYSKKITVSNNGTVVPDYGEYMANGVGHWCVAAMAGDPDADILWEYLEKTQQGFRVDQGSERCFEWHWRQVVGL